MTARDSIPEAQRAAVTRGLTGALGADEFEDIQRLTRGRSPGILVFRIVVRGRAYLLRIITRTDDATRHFTNMKAAADAGLAPRVWYASVEDRISITDFVETAPLPMSDAVVVMPRVLRKLHALPPFPGVPHHINTSCMFLLNKGPALDGLLRKIQEMDVLPKAETEALLSRYAQLAAAYPLDDADMVSSHNDLFKPDNILFDGQRVWLVDWEAAFLNDRYADLAVLANLIVTNEAEERVYLEEYFGTPPDAHQKERFLLMQQIAHVFYTMAFLFLGSAGKPVDLSVPAPSLREFHRRMWTGEIELTDIATKVLYGRAHLAELTRTRWDKL